jgi:hypothetical protein
MFHPALVLQIPVHGAGKALLKCHRRLPAQFLFDPAAVNGIAKIMAGTVPDKGDQFC